MRALREYEATLNLPRIKRILVDVLAIVAALYSAVYAVMVKLLDEAAKGLYGDFIGYKGLLKQMTTLRKIQPRIQQIIETFHSRVDTNLIRTIS